MEILFLAKNTAAKIIVTLFSLQKMKMRALWSERVKKEGIFQVFETLFIFGHF